MRRTVLALLLLAFPACSSPPPPRPSDADIGLETARFGAFLDEVFQQELDRDPERQARLGFKTDYGRWTDRSDEFERESDRIRRRNLERLRTEFSYGKLDSGARRDYRLFESELEQAIEGHRWRNHGYLIDQMNGVHAEIPAFLANVHRVDDRADVDSYIRRLQGIGPLLDQVVTGLERRERLGVMPPKFVFGKVLGDCRNILTGAPFTSGADSTVLADFRRKLDGLDLTVEDKLQYVISAEHALLTSMKPGYDRLMATLRRHEQIATTDDGCWKLPDGRAYYAWALRRATTTDLSADEIHRLGVAEVARIHEEMRSIIRRVDFRDGLPDFFVFMREDPSFAYPAGAEGREQYLARANEVLDAMRARLDDLVGLPLRAELVVKAVEPYRERSAGKAFYSAGAPDGSRPGIYYVNLSDLGAMPTYQLEALAYHEGIPGHHLQISIAQSLTSLPRFRRFGGHAAYNEGWALYSERLAKEAGFYTDPYSDFGRLAMELWRACRLVVDTGIHDQRWTREQAIEYLKRNTPNPDEDCVKAVERYIVMPGQATAYAIGMRRILDLRAEAQSELGQAFNLRRFHDFVLSGGSVPLDALSEMVEQWIASQRG
jgi:uncharacterized protein (DUF885 family)